LLFCWNCCHRGCHCNCRPHFTLTLLRFFAC